MKVTKTNATYLHESQSRFIIIIFVTTTALTGETVSPNCPNECRVSVWELQGESEN